VICYIESLLGFLSAELQTDAVLQANPQNQEL
jgi:hypothetical protein